MSKDGAFAAGLLAESGGRGALMPPRVSRPGAGPSWRYRHVGQHDEYEPPDRASLPGLDLCGDAE